MKLYKILKDLETFDKFPKLQCPFCHEGHLLTDNTEKIDFTNVSSKKHFDLVGEPTDLVAEYSYVLVCDNQDCEEKGVVVGKKNTVESGYDNGFDEETGEELHSGFPTYKSKFSIDYLSIPVNLITIPENVDNNLKDCLISSFLLFWVDLNACGSRLRFTIEILFDYLNVVKKDKLYQRIQVLKNDINHPYTELAEKFTALRLFGNESTHTFKPLDKSDVVKSFEVVEFCLNEIFSTYKSEINTKANELANKYRRNK